jgi:DNA-binding response OmpR family regulator
MIKFNTSQSCVENKNSGRNFRISKLITPKNKKTKSVTCNNIHFKLQKMLFKLLRLFMANLRKVAKKSRILMRKSR